MSAYTFSMTINGLAFPIDSFENTSGVYGSAGHLKASSSIDTLTALGIDLVAITADASAPVEVNLFVTQDSGTSVRVFGGEYVDAEWSYDDDRVDVHARDWAGQLVDQKRVLTQIAIAVVSLSAPLVPGQNPAAAGTSNVNQSLAQVVTSIAQEFGMTPVLNLTGGVSGSTTLGTLYGASDQTFLATPQSLWEILNQLARDAGYDVYVTPNKELVFGQAGVGIAPLALSYKTNPVPDGSVPCRSLRIGHHPRRNGTFRVIVFSYDAGKGQQTTGQATVVGANLAGSAGLKPGIWTGNDAVTANGKLAGIKVGGVTAAQVPLYSFRFDGLAADQATNKALAIATDIAKREFILSAEIDGYAGATPTQIVSLASSPGPDNVAYVNPAFTGNTFYMNGFTHSFSLRAAQRGSPGFVTRIKALDVPTLGTGAAGNNDGPLI